MCLKASKWTLLHKVCLDIWRPHLHDGAGLEGFIWQKLLHSFRQFVEKRHKIIPFNIFVPGSLLPVSGGGCLCQKIMKNIWTVSLNLSQIKRYEMLLDHPTISTLSGFDLETTSVFSFRKIGPHGFWLFRLSKHQTRAETVWTWQKSDLERQCEQGQRDSSGDLEEEQEHQYSS